MHSSVTRLTVLVLLCFMGIFVQGASAQVDLIEGSVTVTGTTAAGGTVQVSDVVTNQGASAAGASYTQYFLSTNGTTKGTFLGIHTVPALAAGASSTAANTNITLPLNITGNYYVMACANGNNAVVESVTTNNCAATTVFAVAGPDLVETGVSVAGNVIPGAVVQLTETVRNQGAGSAMASYSNFFLSTNGTTKGAFLGYRNIAGLAATAGSGATTNVTLPSNIAGTYFVIACANGNNAINETDKTNNCTASASFVVNGANFTEAISTPQAAVTSGSAITVTDTVSNAGGGSASQSYTTLWLSTNGSTRNTFLASRYTAALAAGASAAPVNTNITLPSNLSGAYFLMACANSNNAIVENSYADNCASTALNIVNGTTTAIVDPAGLDSATCGSSTTPCQTIAGALAVAPAKTTILLKSGTFTEQVNLTRNISLLAANKYAAVIQAPATLTPNGDGTTSIIRVGNGATATLSGLTVQGPGPSGCGSITYGIFVADANATIADNKILSIRDNPFSGCQNGVGIRFGSKALGYVGHTGTVTNNTVTDFQKGGIVVDGDNTNVTVSGNTVTGQNKAGVNGQNGIQISRNAKGTVSNNTISNAAYFVACPTDAADPNFALCNQSGANVGPKNSSAAGVLVYDINGGVTISGNSVTGNDIGIWVAGDGPGSTNGSTNVLVRDNSVTNNRASGIFIDSSSSGISIYNNTAKLNGQDAGGNVVGFIDTNFAQGFGYDLVDENTNASLNDWGYSGLPGAAPNTFDTNWGNGKGVLINY